MKRLRLDRVVPLLYWTPARFRDGTVGKRVHLNVRGATGALPGYDVRRFNDWRGLEARAVALYRCAASYSRALRRYVACLAVRAAAIGCDQVWFVDEEIPTRVLVADVVPGCSDTRFIPIGSIVKRGLREPGARGMSVVGRRAANAVRYFERMHTLSRRAFVYEVAFNEAIEARIRKRTKLERRSSPTGRLEPAAYVVNNEGRTYVITVEPTGKVEWRARRCFVC